MQTTTLNAAETAAATTAASSRKRLDLGGLKKPAKSGKTEYPVLPETPETSELVRIIRDEAAQFEALKGSLEIHKAELTAIAAPFYFGTYHGQLKVESSVSCRATNDETKTVEEVLVCFQNRYKETTEDAPIMAVMGEENFGRFIRDSFSIKIDGDLVPLDSAQELIGELQDLFARYNAGAALTAKQIVKPTPEFHLARHSAFTPAENLEINRAIPIVTQVKTKGRGK